MYTCGNRLPLFQGSGKYCSSKLSCGACTTHEYCCTEALPFSPTKECSNCKYRFRCLTGDGVKRVSVLEGKVTVSINGVLEAWEDRFDI